MKWNSGSKVFAVLMSLRLAGLPAPVLGLEMDRSHTALVRVDGMVCYFCTSGIEKICKLKRLGKGYSTDLKKGLFKVKIGDKQLIPQPGTFERIVKDSGFTFRGVQIVLEGKLVGRPAENAYALWMPEKHQMLRIEPATASVGKLAAASLNRLVRVTLDAKKSEPGGWQISTLQPWTAQQPPSSAIRS